MDWGRAKTVLIWAFLLLNMLLGYQLWMDELNLNTFSENAARREEMNRLLALKEIRLQAEVPEGTPALTEITVTLRTAGRQEAPQPLPEPIAMSALGDAALVRQALKPVVPEIDEYEPDPFAASRDEAVYAMNQLYKQLPMFEMRLELFAEGDAATMFRYAYSEVDPAAAGEAAAGQEALSAYTMLGSLAENYLPPGSVIADVRLGYHGPIFESETQVLAPYWRVVLGTGETYYVHAINGAVEGPSLVSARTGE